MVKKIYETPEAEQIILRPNFATAAIPGTDNKLSVANEDNLDGDSVSEEGGTGMIPGAGGRVR